MEKLVLFIRSNYDIIKEEVLTSQKFTCMDNIIDNALRENNA